MQSRKCVFLRMLLALLNRIVVRRDWGLLREGSMTSDRQVATGTRANRPVSRRHSLGVLGVFGLLGLQNLPAPFAAEARKHRKRKHRKEFCGPCIVRRKGQCTIDIVPNNTPCGPQGGADVYFCWDGVCGYCPSTQPNRCPTSNACYFPCPGGETWDATTCTCHA